MRRRAAAPTVAGDHAPGPVSLSGDVDVNRLVLGTLRSIQHEGAVPLGSPYVDPSYHPYRRLGQHASAISRRHAQRGVMNDPPPGKPKLIRQIARRYMSTACRSIPARSS